MTQVTTGPEDDEPFDMPNEPVSDFDYVASSLAWAIVEDLKLEDLEEILTMAKDGKEFDAAVSGTIWLKNVVREYYEGV